MNNDYFGDRYKWFVGVVKDISDPLNSNRVRVRIKGIHPEDPLGDGGDTSGSGGTTGNDGNIQNASVQTSPLAQISVDKASLPNNANIGARISKHYTLAMLTTSVTLGESAQRCRMNINSLTPEIIYNLANISTNVLDPLHEQFPGLTVTSGWRKGTSNHGPGYAVDVQITSKPGKGISEIFEFVKNNLKGRYETNYHEGNHVHIQLGGSLFGGTITNPVNRYKGGNK